MLNLTKRTWFTLLAVVLNTNPAEARTRRGVEHLVDQITWNLGPTEREKCSVELRVRLTKVSHALPRFTYDLTSLPTEGELAARQAEIARDAGHSFRRIFATTDPDIARDLALDLVRAVSRSQLLESRGRLNPADARVCTALQSTALGLIATIALAQVNSEYTVPGLLATCGVSGLINGFNLVRANLNPEAEPWLSFPILTRNQMRVWALMRQIKFWQALVAAALRADANPKPVLLESFLLDWLDLDRLDPVRVLTALSRHRELLLARLIRTFEDHHILNSAQATENLRDVSF